MAKNTKEKSLKSIVDVSSVDTLCSSYNTMTIDTSNNMSVGNLPLETLPNPLLFSELLGQLQYICHITTMKPESLDAVKLKSFIVHKLLTCLKYDPEILVVTTLGKYTKNLVQFIIKNRPDCLTRQIIKTMVRFWMNITSRLGSSTFLNNFVSADVIYGITQQSSFTVLEELLKQLIKTSLISLENLNDQFDQSLINGYPDDILEMFIKMIRNLTTNIGKSNELLERFTVLKLPFYTETIKRFELDR